MKRWFVVALLVITALLQPGPAWADDNASSIIAGLRASPVYIASDGFLTADTGHRLKALLQAGDHILIASAPKNAPTDQNAQLRLTDAVHAQFPESVMFVVFSATNAYYSVNNPPLNVLAGYMRAPALQSKSEEELLTTVIGEIHDYQKSHPWPSFASATGTVTPQPGINWLGLTDLQTGLFAISGGIVLLFLIVGFTLTPRKAKNPAPKQLESGLPAQIVQSPPRMQRTVAKPASAPGRRMTPVSPWQPVFGGAKLPSLKPIHGPTRPRANRLELASDDPKTIGKYTVVSRLGAGGMGVVYRCTNPVGQSVAVKVLPTSVSHTHGFGDRFRREIKLHSDLPKSRYIVQLLDSDPTGEHPWLAMEFVDALDLNALIHNHHRRGLPEAEVRALMRELATALATLHRNHVVHRDVKPSNVLMPSTGAKLTDFGIARNEDLTRLTRTGRVIGTPAFIAPECFDQNHVPSASADMFSFGGVIYAAATGSTPFPGNDAQVLKAVLYDTPDFTRVPASLRDLVRSCLDKDPAKRLTAAAVAVRLG